MKFKNCKLPLVVGLFIFTALASFNESTNVVRCFADAASEEDMHESTCAKDFENVTERPVITVLTHGLGGDAADWSNNYDSSTPAEVGLEFKEDADSLISKIKELNPGTNLYRINTDGLIYSEYSKTSISENDIDFSSHTIIVPEYSSWKTFPECYNAFDKSIDKISYLYKQKHSGVLPKLNLIGHSMGGIVNMRYAINHPKNVDTLFSLGTPYNGSALDTDFVYNINTSFAEQRCINANCGHHECDIEARRNLWNQTYKNNKHIKFYAFSGETAGSLLDAMAFNFDFGKYINGVVGTAVIVCDVCGGILPRWCAGAILPMDFCVDVDSQKATGYDGVVNFNKVYSAFNCNLNKKNRNEFPVPHNLEAHDDIQDYSSVSLLFSLLPFSFCQLYFQTVFYTVVK